MNRSYLIVSFLGWGVAVAHSDDYGWTIEASRRWRGRDHWRCWYLRAIRLWWQSYVVPKVADSLIEVAHRCERAPRGWWCSREAGHDGPCAARPVD